MRFNEGWAWAAIPLLSGGLTLTLTGQVLAFAQRRAIIDFPTDRSSHARPTPRGGGLAIVAGVLTALVVGVVGGIVPVGLGAGLGGGGLLVAWVGWRDDRQGVPAGFRALVQFVAAIWAVAWLGGYPQLTAGSAPLALGLPGAVLAVVGIVWAVNLFNFMDGIDGLAVVEAVTVATCGTILLGMRGDSGASALAAALAASALAFLRWNWMPARIFLGDVGSNFLGFSLAVLAIWSENNGGPPTILWGVAAMVFVVDATITLLRRWSRGENLVQAHRSHAYQRLTQAGWSHARVSLLILTINLPLSALSIAFFALGGSPLTCLAGGLALALVWYVAAEKVHPM